MQLRTLVPAGLAVLTTAIVGGLASRPAQSAWYAKLKKPPYQPPRQAFPIVWPMLYANIAVTSAATLDELYERGQQQQRRAYIAALVSNLVLNGSWSWLFFNQRRLGASAIGAAALTVSSVDLTRRSMAVRWPCRVPRPLPWSPIPPGARSRRRSRPTSGL
jgi:translocator protein